MRRTVREKRLTEPRLGVATGACAPIRPPFRSSQPIDNYLGDAGHGSQNFSCSRAWRAALLGSIAGGGLLFGYARSARAQVVPPAPPCNTVAGTEVTCTGNVSAGIASAAPYTILNVNTLTANITPASGVDGIGFTSTGSITINSDTGTFSILATGAFADGISAFSFSVRAVTVDSTGDITSANRYGIYARNFGPGAGAVSVTSDGAIQANSGGINARSNSGAITIDSTGDVTSTNGGGIVARNDGAGAGDVKVTSDGAIQANSGGIRAISSTGAVTVDSTGDVTSTNGGGISANSRTGAVTVDSTGDITSANSYGIYAIRSGAGAGGVKVTSDGAIQANRGGIYARSITSAVTVDNTGDITSTNGSGIVARNFGYGADDVKVTSDGTIQAGGDGIDISEDGTIQAIGDGIYARSNSGAVTVDSTGDVTSDYGRGIHASNYGASAGNVSVTSAGAIQANGDGILARSSTGAVTVDSTGDVTSDGGAGINAFSYGADVKVTSDGAIQAYSVGIFANSYTGAVTVDNTGDVTSDGSAGINALGVADVKVTSDGAIQAYIIGINGISFSSGDVTVDSTGDVTSDRHTGINAQSFGAGDVTVTSAGAVQGSMGISALSNSGDVKVTSDGTIQANNFGILARSNTGAVTVDSTGDITSTFSDAVRTQFGSTANVILRSGIVTGADDGVEFYGGVANTLKNYAALSGGTLAVRGGIGDETVNNYNLITGNVDLGSGTNAFNNLAGGTFRSGATVNLGAGNTLTNEGNLSPGGIGTVQSTALTGNLVQTGTGTFTVDLDKVAQATIW